MSTQRPVRELESVVAASRVMSASRFLPVVALALAIAFPAADLVINRPAGPQLSGTVLVNSDPSWPIHTWTVPGPGGDWGLVGFSQAQYRARETELRFGSQSVHFGFSIYAVAGFAACIIVAAVGFATAAFRREHENAG